MTEVKGRLSSTELYNLLKNSQIEKFRMIVSTFFSQNKTDHASGLKLLKTIATFAYDEKSQNDKFVDILEDFKLSIETVIQHTPTAQLTDNLLKELYDNSSHVLMRLVKLKQIHPVKSFWPELFRVSTKFQDQRSILGRAYSLYAALWKFSLESSASSVSELLGLLDIAQGSLEFFLVLEKTDKFTSAKFLEKVSKVIKTFSQKGPGKEMLEKITSIVLNFCSKLSDKSKKEEFALLLFATFYQIAPGSLAQCLPQVRQMAEDEKLLAVLDIFTNIQAGRGSGSLEPGLAELSSGALTVLLPIFSKFVSSVSSSRCSSSPHYVIDVCQAVTGCLQQARGRPALLTILERLGYLLFFLVKNNEAAASEERTQAVAAQLFQFHLESLLSQEEEAETSRWTNLYVNSYNAAAKFYNRKLYQPCDDLLTITVQAGWKLVRSDPAQAESLMMRLKLQGDGKFRLKEFRAGLKCVAAQACVLLSAEGADEAALRKLSDLGSVWLSYKSSWLLSVLEGAKEAAKEAEEAERAEGAEVAEVHEVNILGLLEEEEETRRESWVMVSLARAEITWYRRQHTAGVNLTQSWVSSMAALLRVTSEQTDKALVLLEQTWVYWLGDNAEDLECGARCAEKAGSLLTGHHLESLAWFWRFQCEHRLLAIQVSGEMERMERNSKKEEPVRREVAGLGGEVKEGEPTPAYPGLELSVQLKLVKLLEAAVQIWRTKEFSPSDWFPARTICQFYLSAAFSLRLLGHDYLPVLRLVVETGGQHGATEETLLALTELAEAGEEVDLPRCLELGRSLSQKKGGNNLSQLVGLALSADLVRRGSLQAAEDLLQRVVDHQNLKSNTMFNVLIKCEASLRLSQLKLSLGSRSSGQEIRIGAGPLEIANRCWQFAHLSHTWWQDDVRNPAKQDVHFLWLGPHLADLHLRSLQNFASLFRLASAPRELKLYLKTGLKFAQERCLALRSARLLVELAQFSLLCDDEQAADVHLEGTQFILASVLESDKTAVKVKTGDNSRVVRLPGQEDLSMSPNLIRHNNNPPEYLDHPPVCSCHPCSLPLLHSTIIGLLFSQAWGLVIKQDLSAALGLFSTGLQVHREARGKVTGVERDRLDQVVLHHLAQQGECLAWHRLWPEYDKLSLTVETLLSSSRHWLQSSPSIFVRCLEQRYSVTMLREKAALQEMMGVGDTEDVVDMMSALSCSTDEIQVTPDISRKTNSRAATPKKAAVPSLGVGDPGKLAKKLEEALLIEDPTSPPSPAEEENRRKVPRKPRFVAPPVTQKKIVPKIVLDEGTPRKFFKSKMSETKKSDVLNTFDDFKTPAKSLKSLSNFEVYNELKTPKSTKSKKVLSEDLSRTPAPASIRRPGRGSVRKVSKDDGDDPFATPAASGTRRRGKPPKASRDESDEEVFSTPAATSIRKPGRSRSAKKVSEENQPDENFQTPVSVSASARRPRSSTNRKKDEAATEEGKKSTRKKKEEPEVSSLGTRSSTRLRRI